MRSSEQISRTPEQWADFKRDERRRALVWLLGTLRRARERREEWYVWVTEGQSELTLDQYEAVKAKRAARRKSA